MDFVENPGLLVHEAEVVGIDHCYLGSLYAEQNDLPAPTQAAMRYHHEIEEATHHHKVIGLVAAADHMANYLQRCQDPLGYDLNRNRGFEFVTRDWSSEKKTSFARSIPTIMNETIVAAARQADPKPPPANGSVQHKPTTSPPPAQRPSLLGSVRAMFGM